MNDRVGRIRHFNRVLTRRLGLLDESFLGCGVSLGKARILFEIREGTVGVQLLRAKLDLDSGQMSRMLRSLEAQRLVVTSVDPADARARVLALTPAGRAKLRQLESRADVGARGWLAPLSEAQQDALDRAMSEVVRLLSASEVVVEPEDPGSEVAAECFDRFFGELDERFDGGFDRTRTNPALERDLVPPAGLLLVARLHDRPVGCAALVLDRPEALGEVKRMWVAPEVRGIGLGRRMLEALERHARRAGVRRLRLSTNRALHEAQALYRSSGFRPVPRFDREPYAHLAFEKKLK